MLDSIRHRGITDIVWLINDCQTKRHFIRFSLCQTQHVEATTTPSIIKKKFNFNYRINNQFIHVTSDDRLPPCNESRRNVDDFESKWLNWIEIENKLCSLFCLVLRSRSVCEVQSTPFHRIASATWQSIITIVLIKKNENKSFTISKSLIGALTSASHNEPTFHS